MRRLGAIIFSHSLQQSYSCPTVQNNSVFVVHLKVKRDNRFNFRGLELEGEKKPQYFLLVTRAGPSVLLSPLKTISDMKGDVLYLKMYIKRCQQHPGGQRRVPPRRLDPAAAHGDSTPPWVAALWWLSVSLVMSLAALTQVICMHADSACDVLQRQWCTYHFPPWLIEDCNLCWTFSLITHVSGSKTRTLSLHWAPGSSRAFSLQEDWSLPLRWAQFSSNLHYCYKCRIECIWQIVVKQWLSEDDTGTEMYLAPKVIPFPSPAQLWMFRAPAKRERNSIMNFTFTSFVLSYKT